jgi:hypothetical protein
LYHTTQNKGVIMKKLLALTLIVGLSFAGLYAPTPTKTATTPTDKATIKAERDAQRVARRKTLADLRAKREAAEKAKREAEATTPAA